MTSLYYEVFYSRQEAVNREKQIKKKKRFFNRYIVKNPYFLAFIGLEEKASYTETDLESAIINHLQDFLTNSFA